LIGRKKAQEAQYVDGGVNMLLRQRFENASGFFVSTKMATGF